MGLLKTMSVVALMPLLLFSCRKTVEPVPQRTKSQMLTEGSWRLVEAYTNTEKDGVYNTEDIYAELDECEKDDFISFAKEKKLVLDRGAVKCDQAEPQTSVSQEWVLVSNTQIELTNVLQQNSYEVTILELTETTLHLRVTGTEQDGTHFETTYKYKKLD